jgi:hypothetical protein
MQCSPLCRMTPIRCVIYSWNTDWTSLRVILSHTLAIFKNSRFIIFLGGPNKSKVAQTPDGDFSGFHPPFSAVWTQHVDIKCPVKMFALKLPSRMNNIRGNLRDQLILQIGI